MIADMKAKSIFTTNSGPILSAQLRNRGKFSPKSQNEVKDNIHTQNYQMGTLLSLVMKRKEAGP